MRYSLPDSSPKNTPLTCTESCAHIHKVNGARIQVQIHQAEEGVTISLHDVYAHPTCYERSESSCEDSETAWERLTYQLRAKIADDSNLGPYTVEKFRHDMSGIKARHEKLRKEKGSQGGRD